MSPSDNNRSSRRQSGLLSLPPLCSFSARNVPSPSRPSPSNQKHENTWHGGTRTGIVDDSSRFAVDSSRTADLKNLGMKAVLSSEVPSKFCRDLPPSGKLKIEKNMHACTEKASNPKESDHHPQHFLQGLQLNDQRYNVLDIPSPPSPSRTGRRRYSLSATTSSRPLRDLTSDPNFENTAKNRNCNDDDDEGAITKRRLKNKRCRNSLCHVESPFQPTVGNASKDVEFISIRNQSCKEETGNKRSRQSLCVVPSGLTSKESSTEHTTSTASLDDSDANENPSGVIYPSPRKISLDMSISQCSPPPPEHDEIHLTLQASSGYPLEGCDFSLAKIDATKLSKQRRQSCIGIPPTNKSNVGKIKKRHSLLSPMEIASLPPVPNTKVQTANSSSSVAQDLFRCHVEETADDSPRLFPELPKPDAKLIAPVLSEARKLIHAYTRGLGNNGVVSSSDMQSPFLKKIEEISGYVITPPVTEEQIDKLEWSECATNKMDLWLRMGPDLKRMEKFKKETAAAVEEVTETRIEKHRGKYKYFHLDKSNGIKPMKPAEYEARYTVMQEEVFKIRSQCWEEYFDELVAHSAFDVEKGNVEVASDTKSKSHDDSRLVGPAAEHRETPPGCDQEFETQSIENSYKVTEKSVEIDVEKEDGSFDSSATGETVGLKNVKLSNDVERTKDKSNTVMEICHEQSGKRETEPESKQLKLHSNAATLVTFSKSQPSRDIDAVLRSPLSLDADAYRVAGGRYSELNSEKGIPGNLLFGNQDDMEVDVKIQSDDSRSSESLPAKDDFDKDDMVVDTEQIDDLFSPLPSREEPSLDPEIARAEKRLWKEIDVALDKYSREVLSIRGRRAVEKAKKLVSSRN